MCSMVGNDGNSENSKSAEQGESKENKIVVIGNGFDISLGLKTSYQNFIEYIKERHHFSEDIELYEYNRLFLKKYEKFNLNWSDFESLYEETVRKVNNRFKHEDLQDSFEITVLNDAITALEEDFHEYISDEYQKWLQQNTVINQGLEFKKFSKKVNPFMKKLIGDKDAYFINFNYTDTLEDLCEDILYDENLIKESRKEIRQAKKRIAHIHGSIVDDNILFGGGFADRKDTKDIHYSKSLLNDKLFRIKENDKLNTTRKNILTKLKVEKNKFDLYIIGHSLQGSDFPFLRKMLKKAKRVFIFYYESDYTAKMEELIREIGSSIVEKVILVPFIEILLEDELVIDRYATYETIEPFVNNKFPKESTLEELALTANHFIFKNITELTITSDNVEIVLKLIEKLQENRIPIQIKKVCFSGTLEEMYIERMKNSQAFIRMFSYIEKVTFENTGIDIEFLGIFLRDTNKLVLLKLNNCTLLNNGVTELDISVCESLVRLEIVDCTFNIEDSLKPFIFSSEKLNNNIRKLVFEKNENIIMDNTVLENAKNLLEVSIIFSDTDTHKFKAHLKNIEILRMDCSTTEFPKITVGNDIKEITITGYPAETLKFSSLMKNDEYSLGFPKFKLLQLNSPDNITSFSDLDIDILLDVFSENIKLIIDEQSILIEEYYKKHRNVEVNPFLSTTKEVIEKTFSSIINSKEVVSQEVISDFEGWYCELSELIDKDSDPNLFLSIVKDKINVEKNNQKVTSNESVDTEVVSMQKSKKDISYSEVDRLLFSYNSTEKNYKEMIIYFEREQKNTTVIAIYIKVLALINKQNLTETAIFKVKEEKFKQERDNIIKDFSKEWFVSTDKLNLSASQYKKGIDPIPGIGAVIDSRNYEEFKNNHPEVGKFKYPQEMKKAWKKVLEEQIVMLNEEIAS